MIFLDVGTHEGHTLEEVTKPAYEWDEIHGFEPMPDQWSVAFERFPTVQVHPFGLADFTGPTVLYGGNTVLEASLYADKVDVDPAVATEVDVMRATEFFDTVDGEIVMKLNCEGAEVPILEDLCGSGAIHRCLRVMVDFDARRVPSLAGRVEPLIAGMTEAGFDRFDLCEQVMVGGTHQDRIANWLRSFL